MARATAATERYSQSVKLETELRAKVENLKILKAEQSEACVP